METRNSEGGKMKASRTIPAVLAIVIVIGIFAVALQAAPAPQSKNKAAKAEAKPQMPKEVAALIQEGLATRQGRQDMPFGFYKHLILPAQGANLYPVFFFKAKNGDLGYAPSASGSGEMETTLNVIFEILKDEGGALKPMMWGKSQALLKADGGGYSPDNEDWYSFGMALPAGKYTLALVLMTPDMKKMSVGYHDVTLPGVEAYQDALWPTEPVIVAGMEQVEPDPRPTVHRGYFTWGAIRFVPNDSGAVGPGETLEVFFFVLGASIKDPASARPTNDLEVNFEVHGEDGNPAIKWAPTSYEAYFVNQPLPLVQTLQTTDPDGKVEKDEKPLAAGKYTLVAKVADKVSGKTAEVKMPFEVK
jgi:hypothetical protein